MKLSFATIIDDKPNYFLEKIWKGLLLNHSNLESMYMEYQRRHLNKFGSFWDGDTFREFLLPKVHTLRKDLKKEWKPGMEIQLVINQYMEDEFQFAPALKCQSTQNIQIDYSNSIINGPALYVDYELLGPKETNQFAINDGFANAYELFDYFKEEINGTLIHWTSLRY
jgi:hypothetical protein